jgi:nicotinamidase-related amidase
MGRKPPARRAKSRRHKCFAGRAGRSRPFAPGIELWPDLEVTDGDLVVSKTRFSAFVAGSSSLEAMLRERGIEAVLVAGTITNTCCDATARGAMFLDFRTTMITDANATITDPEHNAALLMFYLSFGDIVDTASLVRRYGG